MAQIETVTELEQARQFILILVDTVQKMAGVKLGGVRPLEGEVAQTAPVESLEGFRQALRGNDGHLVPRRVYASRSRYSFTPLKNPARMKGAIEKLTPAGRDVVAALQAKSPLSREEIVETTKLSRKTVENLLSTIRKAGLLDSHDV